jgi:hypothetical protein
MESINNIESTNQSNETNDASSKPKAVRKPMLGAKLEKSMIIGFWFTQLLKDSGVLDDAGVTAAYHQLALYEDLDAQKVKYNDFEEQLTEVRKTMRKNIASFHKAAAKPPKVPRVKKEKASLEDGEAKPVAKRGRKGKATATAVVDSHNDFIANLVKVANTPVVSDAVELPATTENEKKPRKKPEKKIKVLADTNTEPNAETPTETPTEPAVESAAPVKEKKPRKKPEKKTVTETVTETIAQPLTQLVAEIAPVQSTSVAETKAKAKAETKAKKPKAEAKPKAEVKPKAETKPKAEPVRPPTPVLEEEEDEEEEDIVARDLYIAGVHYLLDESSLAVYSPDTQEHIGTFDSANNSVSLFSGAVV